MAIARAKGKLKGPCAEAVASRQAHLLELHAAGQHSVVELAELFEVSLPTVCQVLERTQTPGSAA